MTNLTRLTWKLPELYHVSCVSSHITIIPHLLDWVQITCPLLQWLDIAFIADHEDGEPISFHPSPTIAPSITYSSLTSTGSLESLRHFGFKDQVAGEYCWPYCQFVQDFIQRQQNSISSLSISIDALRTRDELDYILGLCDGLPRLKKIALTRGRTWPSNPRTKMSPEAFLSPLITSLTTPGRAIESFALTNIASPMTYDIFKMFGSWAGLKYLRIGGWNLDEERYTATYMATENFGWGLSQYTHFDFSLWANGLVSSL